MRLGSWGDFGVDDHLEALSVLQEMQTLIAVFIIVRFSSNRKFGCLRRIDISYVYNFFQGPFQYQEGSIFIQNSP
jgi:hypothetical protein